MVAVAGRGFDAITTGRRPLLNPVGRETGRLFANEAGRPAPVGRRTALDAVGLAVGRLLAVVGRRPGDDAVGRDVGRLLDTVGRRPGLDDVGRDVGRLVDAEGRAVGLVFDAGAGRDTGAGRETGAAGRDGADAGRGDVLAGRLLDVLSSSASLPLAVLTAPDRASPANTLCKNLFTARSLLCFHSA